jgi:large subunit ribosomal protein L18
MTMRKRLNVSRERRANRVRNQCRGSAARPRLSVYRSHKHVYAQLIDDEQGRTLCSVSSRQLAMPYGGNVASARAVGEALGKKAIELDIRRVGFDRGPYKYHGRVKALAEAARQAGLQF